MEDPASSFMDSIRYLHNILNVSSSSKGRELVRAMRSEYLLIHALIDATEDFINKTEEVENSSEYQIVWNMYHNFDITYPGTNWWPARDHLKKILEIVKNAIDPKDPNWPEFVHNAFSGEKGKIR